VTEPRDQPTERAAPAADQPAGAGGSTGGPAATGDPATGDPPARPGRELGRDVGDFIRDLRRSAGVSLRQLASKAGVSNPYLSQVERGLRRPSAEVLQQIAGALRVSTPVMYLRAGLLDAKDREGVLAAIAADPGLTLAQKQSLSQIYETFRRENSRHDDQRETETNRSDHEPY
jgi:transcriptional regulator with XRE-family HTH domain